MSTITYSLQSGKINFEVRNITRDFQVVYLDGKPDSVQIWRYTEYWSDGQLMKTDPAACTVMKVADLPQEVGTTGLRTPDILEVLEAVLASTVAVPAGATDVTLPTLPEGLVTGLEAAEAAVTAARAEADAVLAEVARAKNDLAGLNASITTATNDLSAQQNSLIRFGEVADKSRYDTTVALTEMEARLEAAKQNLILTQDALVSKCSEATALSTAMREAFAKMEAILDQHSPAPVILPESVAPAEVAAEVTS